MRRELQIIHTDLKPENVMLGAPLSSREWRIPGSSGTCKELMAAYLAEAKAANRPVTKNQKKKLKRKFKKQLSMGQIVGPTLLQADDCAVVKSRMELSGCIDEFQQELDWRDVKAREGATAECKARSDAQTCSMVRSR
jgi:hypothetical protein